MKTKTLILSAIIAALPFSVMARDLELEGYTIDSQSVPERVPSNGVVPMGWVGPYTTAEPTAADETHIATTAYVKGAYNDLVRAINRVDDSKQLKLFTTDSGEEVSEEVIDVGTINSDMFSPEYELPYIDYKLISAGAVVVGIKSQRATIYTTWDDDSATTDVALKTVFPDD